VSMLRAAVSALLAACCVSCASAQGNPEAAIGETSPGGTAMSEASPGEVRTYLQTGHRGEVLAMEYDEGRGLVFSAGDDGTLRVWDLARRTLVARIGIGRLPLTAIAVNPAGTQVAVIESDGVRSFAVSAWDWLSMRRLFRVTLAGEPLFLRYSGGGSWLMLGESAWQGLRLLTASDGSPRAFLPEGFGIVGFAEVSRSERTILTYLPSGRLQYRDAASGGLSTEVRATPYLSGLRISRDRRYAAGTTGSDVLLIDLVSGVTRARLPLAGVRSLDLSPAGDEIACVAPSAAGRLELSRWTLVGDTFLRKAASTPDGITVARYAGSALVAGAGGGLRIATAAGDDVTLARDELTGITGLVAGGGYVAAASSEWIWIFRLPANGLAGTEASLTSEPVVVRNPLAGPTGLAFVSGKLVAWRQGEGTPAALTIDAATGTVTGTVAGLAAPLLQLEPASGRLVSLDRTGTVRLVALPGDSGVDRPLFEAWLPGTLCVLAMSERELVGGRTPIGGSGGSLGGTLLRIDMQTGETVAVPGESRSTYGLAWDPDRGALYSLGIDAGGDTVLASHAGPGFESERVLSRFEGEDLSASLGLDADTGRVYASLGYGGIIAWDGNSTRSLPSEGRVPRRLAIAGGVIGSVNRDATVSLWDPAAQRLVADLYLLASGDWCLAAANGRWSATDGAAPLVRVTTGGSPAGDASAWRN
jgi:hypothetical protein